MTYFSLRLRWYFAVQILFLTLALLLFFSAATAKADPIKPTKTHEALAVIMAAGFTDLQGPVEYRPQAGGQRTTRATKFLQTASLELRDLRNQGAVNNAVYSGNRPMPNAKP